MFIRLLILFSTVPILELYLLISVGKHIGATATIALVIATGIAGAYLAHTQGLDLLRRIQQQMNRGQLPAEELLDGAMVLTGGLLLLTPGLATDLLGFFLLIPISRNLMKRLAKGQLVSYIHSHRS